jgi:excinuclease UvrABC ATPase subunit
MRPDGGDRGGRIVSIGTPEDYDIIFRDEKPHYPMDKMV